MVDKIIQESWKLGRLAGLSPKWVRDSIYWAVSKVPSWITMEGMWEIYTPSFL